MKKILKVIGIYFLAAIVLNIAWQFKISLGIADEVMLKSSIFATEYPLITYLASGIAGTLPQLIICAVIVYAIGLPLLSAFIMTLLCIGGDYGALREAGSNVSDAEAMAIIKSIPDFIFFWVFSVLLFKVAPRKKKQKGKEEKKDNNI